MGEQSLNSREHCGSPAKSAPGEAGEDEEQRRPEQERKAKLKEDAKNERGGGENAADSFDERIAKLKDDTRKIGPQRSAVIFHQGESDMGLGSG